MSPALAELRPHLEGSLGERWSQYGGDGSDIHGGWFVWALREAAYLEGHHADGRAAEDYYRRLAREINAACDAGRLDCGPPRRGMRPPLAAAHARPFASTFVAGAALLADVRSLVTPAPFSWGPAEALARFRSVAGAESRPPLEADWIVQGWAFGLRPGLELALLDPAGEEVPSEVRWDPSPDVERHFADVGNYPGIEHCRFELRGTCSGTCALRLRRPDGRHWTIRLDGSRRSLDRPHAKAHLDAVLRAGEDQFGVHRRLDARRWDVVLAIGRAYTLVMPWLSAAALVAFAASGVGGLTRRSLHPAWLAGAVLLLAVGARLALVALIDATSFSALETRYLSSAYPLALLFVGLTLCTAADTVRRRPSRDDA